MCGLYRTEDQMGLMQLVEYVRFSEGQRQAPHQQL